MMTTKLSRERVNEIEEALYGFAETLSEEDEWDGDGGGWYYWEEMQWYHTMPADSQYAKGPVPVPGVGAVKVLDSYTGGEGGGEDAELLFQVTTDDGDTLYFQKDGYYASYNGTNWDGSFTHVEPVQVVVTQYQAVK